MCIEEKLVRFVYVWMNDELKWNSIKKNYFVREIMNRLIVHKKEEIIKSYLSELRNTKFV